MIDIHEGVDFTLPRCPHCHEPLQLSGKIIETDGMQQSIAEWTCLTHGPIGSLPDDQKPSQFQPGT